MLDKMKLYTYYIMIGCVSFIALAILPFVGSVEGEMVWPQSTAEWIIWALNRVVVSVINCMMFYCFMQQGKVNILKNENYIKANQILLEEKDKEAAPPKSPRKWQFEEYMHKGVSILVSTLTASMALTQMVLKYDLATMISYFIVIFMGLIFGILQMKKAEDYWTGEYLEYALEVQKKHQEAENEVFDETIEKKEEVEQCSEEKTA